MKKPTIHEAISKTIEPKKTDFGNPIIQDALLQASYKEMLKVLLGLDEELDDMRISYSGSPGAEVTIYFPLYRMDGNLIEKFAQLNNEKWFGEDGWPSMEVSVFSYKYDINTHGEVPTTDKDGVPCMEVQILINFSENDVNKILNPVIEDAKPFENKTKKKR